MATGSHLERRRFTSPEEVIRDDNQYGLQHVRCVSVCRRRTDGNGLPGDGDVHHGDDARHTGLDWI